MSAYHIREVSRNSRSARVVFHVSLPDANNLGGTTYRLALVESSKVKDSLGVFRAVTSEMSDISAPEASGIADGSICEVSETLSFKKDDSGAQKLATVAARATSISIEKLSEIQSRLRFFGKSGGAD